MVEKNKEKEDLEVVEITEKEGEVISVNEKDYISYLEHVSRMRLVMIACLVVFLVTVYFFASTRMVHKSEIPVAPPTQADLSLTYEIKMVSGAKEILPLDNAVSMHDAVNAALTSAIPFFNTSVPVDTVSNMITAKQVFVVVEYTEPISLQGLSVQQILVPVDNTDFVEGMILVKEPESTEYKLFYNKSFDSSTIVKYVVE